jgi:hypothetical protein
MVMGALGPVVMLIAIVAARPWLGSTEGRASAPEPANERAPETPRVPSTPGPTSGVADKTTTIDPPSPDTPSDQRTAATIPVQATVVKAQLCAALEDWHCDPPDRPIPAGQLFFYTQVKSASSIGIQHRWYQGSRLQHVVDLRVDGSTSGYRSFSRYTMGDGNAGNWRVELRTEDGVLLQEERFLVQ